MEGWKSGRVWSEKISNPGRRCPTTLAKERLGTTKVPSPVPSFFEAFAGPFFEIRLVVGICENEANQRTHEAQSMGRRSKVLKASKKMNGRHSINAEQHRHE